MSDHQTLRDTFAAAAIRGLLADVRYTLGPHEAARHAYTYADAMLSERLRNGAAASRETVTDHDAAPAARADADRERPDNPPARPGDGTGDTPTFTDAEREVLTTVRDVYESHDDDDSCAKIAAVLRALLARHGGER